MKIKDLTKKTEDKILFLYKTKLIIEIVELLNISKYLIKKTLKKYNIKLRTCSEIACMVYANNPKLKEMHSISHRGKTTWNKNLSMEDVRVRKIIEHMTKLNIGSKRSQKTRKLMSLGKMGDKNPAKREDVKQKMRKPHKLTKEGRMSLINSNMRRRNLKNYNFKQGFRKDLNCWFRSSWEANIAMLFNHLQIQWEFEKHTFVLKDDIVYIPDFKVGEKLFVEVKGRWTEKSAEKVDLFQEETDNELIVVNSFMYNDLKRMYGDKIENWEN